MKQPLHPNDFADQLEDPERHFPGNFETEGKAVAALLCLCQDAATEIRRMHAVNAELLEALKDAVSTQPADSPIKWVLFARAAIAKATGEKNEPR